MEAIVDRQHVLRWVDRYEQAWRTAGTAGLRELFTEDATYRMSPYEEPIAGLSAIAELWERERAGADEVFTTASEVIAVEGDTAVVRVEVWYGDPVSREYRDLWVIRFHRDGRCMAFEEWPFWPERGHTPAGAP